MPHKCHYCGDIKPCRKEWFYDPLSKDHLYLRFIWPSNSYSWICEDCDTAKKFIYIKDKKKRTKIIDEKEKEIIKDWKKKRDKLLKENDKSLGEHKNDKSLGEHKNDK